MFIKGVDKCAGKNVLHFEKSKLITCIPPKYETKNI